MWTPCVALAPGMAGGGCTRYDERPPSCRDFECLWLKGLILTDDGHRPDRCGLVLTAHPEQRTVEAVETSPGSSEGPDARALIERLRAAQLNVVVTRPSGRERLAPLTTSARPEVSVRAVSPAPALAAPASSPNTRGPFGKPPGLRKANALRARAGGLG